ncbi:MAG: hypothetical protein C7B46_05420 [Sulfobacillus benefaciens]|uniref:Uncharacterized protein n=1 Tax=Sulfobacillus benefaciens TaxID=453960 RepID=A0A2T2XIT4_9FIRM|nr:MAG: hypothetical protein C7B46_05420 [Sulfobacillus benefaciens]
MPISSQSKAQEVLAILRAHHDLGSEYDEEMTQQILQLFPDQRPTMTPEDVVHYFKSLPSKDRKKILKQIGYHREKSHHSHITGILVLSIPLLAIAGHIDHSIGVFAVLGLDALAVIADMVRNF